MQSPSRPRQVGLALLTSLIVIVFWQVQVSAQGPTEEQLKLGAQLYAENCAVCHGPDGKGRVGAELSKDWPSIRPDLSVKTTIERGVPGSPMPAWGQDNGGPLGDQDVNDLVAFIMSWEASPQPAELAPTPTQTRAPSAFSGTLGALIVLFGLLVLVAIGVVGALRRKA
jgi:mono/diheme cytochrome c family protein